jgi:putative holliday junction resolvase
MPKAIAIDFGLKRTGLAITDELMMIASPLETVATEKLMSRLRELVQKEKINVFVVGEARHLSGDDSEMTHHQRAFSELLSKTFPEIPVERANEMFTSKLASRALLESGMKKKDRQKKENIDMVSAAILLQGWLLSKSYL